MRIAVALLIAGTMLATPALAEQADLGDIIAANAGRLGDNVNNTDDEFWREVERGEHRAVRRFNDLVSGGVLVRQGNRIVNRSTGQVKNGISRTINDALNAVFVPVEEATVSLSEAFICGIGGGWIGALIGINICAAKQLAVQGRQLTEQQKMTAPLTTNGASDIGVIEGDARGTLGSIDGSLYGMDADTVFGERYQTGMPDGWTFDNAAEHMQQMRSATDLATREAAAVTAHSAAGINDTLMLSDEILNTSQQAGGQTQAIQANTQMLRSLIGVQAIQHASDTATSSASLRVAEEQRAQEIIANQKLERFYGPGTLDISAPPRRAVFN